MNIDLNDSYWDRVRGFVSEHRVDARWILRKNNTEKPLGSLRIVSHPDLQPGFLRATFTYMINVNEKTQQEKLQATEDYQMELEELEVYSVNDNIETATKVYEEPYQALEELFTIKIFE